MNKNRWEHGRADGSTHGQMAGQTSGRAGATADTRKLIDRGAPIGYKKGEGKSELTYPRRMADCTAAVHQASGGKNLD